MKIKLTAIAKCGSEMGTFHPRSGLSGSRNSVFGSRYISKDELYSLAPPNTLPPPERLWQPQKGTARARGFSAQVPLGRESVTRPEKAGAAYWETETTICWKGSSNPMWWSLLKWGSRKRAATNCWSLSHCWLHCLAINGEHIKSRRVNVLERSKTRKAFPFLKHRCLQLDLDMWMCSLPVLNFDS